jgi:seryl-tRNA synthetase
MSKYREASPDQAAFLEELIDARLLIPSGVPGVYGRGQDFEAVRLGLEALVARRATDDPWERLAFPPVLPKRHLEDVDYLKSFPHLAGSIFSFDGTEAEAAEQQERASRHEDWSEFQQATELVLMPAACYPVYPAIAARGKLPDGGVAIDAGGGYVFRHEPSGDPARMQMFHQREMVRIGEPETVQEWRERWRDRAIEILTGLGLDARFDVASDPFFGRTGRMLAASQREQALKFEVLVQIAGPEPTACASFNYHQEHFAQTFGIETAEGKTAHTACLGFGEERITLALFKTHGLDVAGWPDEVREQLWETARV